MDAVDEVKQRLAIEDVMGEYVELKRAGRNFKALSPFSNEKTPSLMISPEKQIWHDFSSGKGGNMFSFVMEMEGLDFKDTLDLLARKAGVDLSQYQRGGHTNTELKRRLTQANELAAKFYQVQFSQHQQALEYVFKQRRLTKAIALQFRLGYAPNNGRALTDFLLGKGFKLAELQKAGLTAKRSHPTDMFRGRLMIPLMDPTGTVIGFTGRLLDDVPGAPKYLNTPQSLLYDKSRHVFGLHLAKDAIRKAKFVVVVEGNMDVIASHQAHVSNVVATAGTAITEMHLKALGRFGADVRLSFDQDSAGLAAAERAIPLAAQAGVSLSMVTISGAKDPDELIRQDPAAWASAVKQPAYAVDWLINQYQKKLDLNTAPGKRQFSDVLLAVIRRLSDPVEQEHYVAKLAKILGVSQAALQQKMAAPRRAAQRKKTVHLPPLDRASQEIVKLQNHLLSLALLVPNLRSYLQPLTPEMLPLAEAQQLFNFLNEQPNFDGRTSPAALKLQNVAEYCKMLTLLFEELYQGLETSELHHEAARLQVRLIEHYVKTKKAALAAALRQATDQQTDQLLAQVKAFDALLKITREERHNSAQA